MTFGGTMIAAGSTETRWSLLRQKTSSCRALGRRMAAAAPYSGGLTFPGKYRKFTSSASTPRYSCPTGWSRSGPMHLHGWDCKKARFPRLEDRFGLSRPAYFPVMARCGGCWQRCYTFVTRWCATVEQRQLNVGAVRHQFFTVPNGGYLRTLLRMIGSWISFLSCRSSRLYRIPGVVKGCMIWARWARSRWSCRDERVMNQCPVRSGLWSFGSGVG
jgi:hypothetical protein